MARATAVCIGALCLLALTGATGVSQHSVAGVEKVIQMLTDMSVKAKQEKKAEQVAFAEFSTWCTQESTNLKGEIKQNSEEIELLDAEIGKLGSDITTLGEGIAALDHSVAAHDANQKQETAQREQDRQDFLTESQDYAESVDALERAIAALQKQDYDRSGKETALLQLTQKAKIPEKAKSLIEAFVAMSGKGDDDFMSYNSPEANAYEFQSGNIIEMLKKLRDEFSSKLGTRQKEEMNSKHAYDMIVADLTDSIENKQKQSKEKSMEKEHKSEKKALSEKQMAATSNVKAENEKTLAAAQTECQEKTMSFKEKQQLRTEEIEAMGKAVEILRSPDVSGSAAKYLDLAQKKPATASLAQLGNSRQGDASEGRHRHVLEFLAEEGQRLHSQRLALLAQKLATDPFAKVKQMIGGMINRLMEEAHQDANHEGFCDTEMGKSKITRNKLSEDIDGISAAVEDGKATVMMLAQSTAGLTAEVQALVKAMGDATHLRKEEKATNAETVKDAQAAQKAIMAATAVLKAFYEKALTATALVQGPTERRWGLKMGVKMGSEEWNSLAKADFEGTVDKGHKDGMQTFGERNEGQQDNSDYGVLALLEVIQADFATLEADTTAAEAAAQKSYDNFMIESKRNQATKDKKISMNNADKAAAQSKLQEDIADLKATQDQLLAADRYHAKLVPQCIDQGMTFEERTAARAAEIASLKEALKILGSDDIATSSL